MSLSTGIVLLCLTLAGPSLSSEFLHDSQESTSQGSPYESQGVFTQDEIEEPNEFYTPGFGGPEEPTEGDGLAEVAVHYQNDWDKDLRVECAKGQAIHQFRSEHDNRREDRRWRFDCKKFSDSSGVYCNWHYRINTWDAPMLFMCPANQYMAGVRSRHDNRREDRRWRFECKKFGDSSGVYCNWHYRINTWDAPMLFMCPANQYMAGVRSRHDNRREDREWDVYCCGKKNYCTKNCFLTGYVNDWDRPLHYNTHGAFTGLLSIHSNHREDRVFKVLTCDLAQC
jgi:hypothetical protein